MKIIDTHCHYNLDPLSSDWKTHWQKAQSEGVTHSVIVGTDYASSMRAIKIAEEEPNLFASIGVHPFEYIEPGLHGTSLDLSEVQNLDSGVIVAIGETGLDYFRFESYSAGEIELIKQSQHTGLREHIALATERKLPLILHVRDTGEDAYWDTLRILDEENYQGIFILHCVSGPLEYVKKALSRGAYISAAGNMTYATAHQLRELVKLTPPTQLLLETDAPFLPPVPHRGKLSEPWMIRLTAEYLHKELSVDLEQCHHNSVEIFPNLKLSTHLSSPS